MIMCSQCHKRVAVIFVTKMENGKKESNGLCLKCAKDLGVPVDNMLNDTMNQLGISPEQMDSLEESLSEMMGNLPSDMDETEDGGAPPIEMPKLFKDGIPGFPPKPDKDNSSEKKDRSAGGNEKGGRPSPDKKKRFLSTYAKNLTQAAREGKIDQIVGRKRELARMMQILCRRQKNNPCLIGEPGVGKTAIAEALAIQIVEGNVPYKLKKKEVYLLDLTALVAGTQFRGQFESRVLGLLNEIYEDGNIILVIDEVHNIVGTGDSEGSVNAANILKPALARGELQIIGATTLNEYRKYIEKDTALERRFQPITVNEPSFSETEEMLLGIKHYYEEFHHILIPESILRRAVELSERYITDRYLPDKAIDLLDEAASALALNSSELNEAYEIHDQLLKLKDERTKIEAETTENEEQDKEKYEQIANIKSKELSLSDRLNKIEPVCQNLQMTSKDLADVIEVWTGIPASTINQNELEVISHLEENLKERIIGQDEAVSAVVRAVKRNRAGVSYKRKPVSFIFAGPTGVGKTELVKQLANQLFSSPETLIRLDMSEFMEKHSVSKIIGAPPGYVGYDEAGQLTEKIRRRPYSVVLFDEIEKAHPDVLNILLQILDDGRITDAHGKTVNFENTIIVMTTNAGSDKTSSTAGFSVSDTAISEQKTQKALSSFLRPEFLNRVDEVITFKSLSGEDFSSIASIMVNETATALWEKGIRLTYHKDVLDFIAKKSYSFKYGARNMRRFIQSHIEDPIAEIIVQDYATDFTEFSLSVKDDSIIIASK